MRGNRKLSRRAFLKGAATGAGMLLVSACVPAAPPGETASQANEVSDQAPAAEPVVLRLHMRAGGETSEKPIYVDRPREFTEETGIQVQLEPIPGSEYWTKIEALAASDTLGDNMFTTQSQWQHSRMVHFGILQAIDDFMDGEGISRDEWLPTTFETCVFDGKTYGLPKTAHPAQAYVWINHELFEEAGIPIPETYGTTWEQYREWANTLAQGDPDRREVYGFFMPTTNFQMFTNGVRSFGDWMLNEDGTDALADSEAWKGFIRFTHAVAQEDKTMPLAANLEGVGGELGLFAAGKLAMMIGNRGANQQVREAIGPEESGKFRWSAIGLAEGPNFIGWGLSLNTHAGTTQSEHKRESFLLTYALSDKRFADLVANGIGYLVGRTNELEEIGDAANDSFIQLQFAQQAKGQPYRIGANFRGQEFGRTIANETDRILLGEREPDDAFFAELDDILDEILAKPV